MDVGLRQEIAERTGAQVGWTEAYRMLAAFLDHTHKKLVELEQADEKAKGPWEKEGENEDDRPRT